MDLCLTEDQRAILDTIVAGPLAWTPLARLGPGPLFARSTAETLLELLDLGLIEVWEARASATLTPLAAEALGVSIREEWVYGSMVEDQFAGVIWDEDGEPVEEVRSVRLRTADEAPRWAPALGPVRPVRSPRYAREYPIVLPELIPAPEPIPEPPPRSYAQRVLWGFLVPIPA
jgi:hypothetical protein